MSLARTLAGGAAALFALLIVGTAAQAATPTKIPGNASAAETQFVPLFGYTSDSCYPSVAVDANGVVNGGLAPTGSITGGCRGSDHLTNSNTYSRYDCNSNGWCAYMYVLYFEKDQDTALGVGHRHDFESVVVWALNGAPQYVSLSSHGDYVIYTADQVVWSGSQPKIIYRKDGIGSHDFRLATASDTADHTPTLIAWDRLPTAAANALNTYDFGNANMLMNDSKFAPNLTEAKPPITFTP